MIGRVVSIKSEKTASVLVERIATHPLYKKNFVQSKKYLVEAMAGIQVGDVVDFVNCKPVSKRKSWKIVKILGKNFAEIAKDQLKKEAEKVIAGVMPEEKVGNRVQGVGSSEETKETAGKSKKKGKEKLVTKP